MCSITRRNFLAASAAAAGIVGLAGCNLPGGSDAMTAPASDSYPIDPDGDDVEALWTSEEVRDGWTRAVNPEGGQTIGVMDPARIIQVNGLAFRDMDGDGKLSLFEDWRQSAEDRATDLAGKLSAEQCIELMWQGGVEDKSEGASDPELGLLDQGSAGGVQRLYGDIDSYASVIAWINSVQARCENRPFGIPYICSADPYPTLGIPSSIGIAPAMDSDLWRKSAMWISRAWRAMGIRCELGPQIDIMTSPTNARLYGAESEDPALARDFTRAFAGGMQSSWGDDEAKDDLGWGSESVATMLKHFVGQGAVEGGRDDHNEAGRYNVYPGGNYEAHLIPFLDGGLHLDSSTGQVSAIMPNYGISFSEDEEYGPLYGGAWNGKQLSIMRNAGWDGVFCSDWGILSGKPRGVEDLTEGERFKLMLESSVDQCGGSFSPTTAGADAYGQMVTEMGEEEALAFVQNTARRILKLMVNVELFDQPYSDRTIAKDILESEAAAEFALECNEKSVMMLKNAGGVISDKGLGDKPKVYIPVKYEPPFKTKSMGTLPATANTCLDQDIASTFFDVVTDNIGSPTGDPIEGETEKQYQESDVVRLSSDELADVAYAIVRVGDPRDAHLGFTGDAEDPEEYLPISLQYRPYTADGDYVRKVSISGNVLPDGTRENRSYFGKSTYATNESELDLVISIREKLPETAKLILIIDAKHPMVFSEIEPYADVILMGWMGDPGPNQNGWYISDEAYLNIIAGKAEPYGLLPFQMPANMETVETQMEDVPRDMEPYTDSEGNVYDFCFGLNWSGVIDDERVSTYKVNPDIEPETEVVRS